MDKFNIYEWRYTYLNEHHGDDFPTRLLKMDVTDFLDELKEKNSKDYDVVEDIMKKHFSVSEINATSGGSSFQTGNGEGYATPNAFKKKKNQ